MQVGGPENGPALGLSSPTWGLFSGLAGSQAELSTGQWHRGCLRPGLRGPAAGTHLFSLWVCLQTSSSGPALSSQQPAVGWSQATPRRQPGLGSHWAPSLISLPLSFLLRSPRYTVLKDWGFYCHGPPYYRKPHRCCSLPEPG